jgi:hypothetical protein
MLFPGRVWRYWNAFARFASALLIGTGVLSAASFGQVRINELMAESKTIANADGSISDWVELVNTSAQAQSLGGYSLTDSSATPRKWVFPQNISIAANGYLVVLLDSSRSPSTSPGLSLNAGFSIKAGGDEVDLYSPASQLVDTVRFGPQVADYSIGRVPSGSGNFTLNNPTPGGVNAAQPLGATSGLHINEWMASPSSGKDWFELYNAGSLPVQLTGLYFTDDKNEPSPVAPLSYIGTGLDGFLQITANNGTNDSEVNFKLSGTGDVIALYNNSTAALIDRVQFGQQTTDISEGRLPDGSDSIRALNKATPGKSNLIDYDGLVVNELLSHTDPPLEDAVEFYNQTASNIDISGWYLSNARGDLKKYKLPAGSVVPAKGYFVVYEGQFGGAAAASPFTFNSAHGDEIYLSQATASGDLTGAIVEESFEPAEHGVSFGRYETSVPGDAKFVAMQHLTFGVDNPSSVEEFRTGKGAPNSAPKIGPVVINEVMYNPGPSGPEIPDNTVDEFIELLNITAAPVAIYDPLHPENNWRLQYAVDIIIPANSSIQPFSYILVVSFDPAVDTAQLAAFRSKYAVPDNVPVFGPYSGKLSNGSDGVELDKPDPPQDPPHPDVGFVPYIRVDKVTYSDSAPWPPEADGTGNSLQRKSAIAFGNDPINWEAAAPTAGRANPSEKLDSDGDGMPDLWEFNYGLNPNNPADASADSDGDGVSNLEEYRAGTNPLVQDGQPQLTIASIQAPAAGPVSVQFSAVPGKSYTLESRDSLSPGSAWSDVTTSVASGTTASLQDGSPVQKARFYRVISSGN